MLFHGIELCCPLCKNDVREEGDKQQALRCDACDKLYPIIFGIPDLRVFPDPYIDIESDRAKGIRVAERFNDLDFEGLVDFYYGITTVVPPKQARQYKRGLMAGVARAQAALTAWENYDGIDSHSNSASLLEIGCGSAPLLIAAKSRFGKLVGVDIAFRWLVVGKKRLHDAGLDIPLICACAEALPLRSAAFERIVADSVVEHVRDQPQTLAEAYRVMRPGGRLFLSTPNRFSIGPDPHVGLWAGGYLPDRWVNAYVLRMGGIPPHRQLLSKAVVSRLLQASGFVNTRVFLPYFPAGQRAQFSMLMNRLIDLYHVARRLPISRELLHLFGPILYAVSHKGENDVG